ncbi:hypothetical protein ACHHYP_13633 [Achlya hypogyna]|uniref:Uncharacterized protein n=1 Tax=Achlya hypogyna TaxID=1202772 RepID=A0A1V9ZFJ8_ACHHY|nr:hypothetical protein ACHHYP_13633 [Achlya hypogyna]
MDESPRSDGPDPPSLPSILTFTPVPAVTYVRCLQLHATLRATFITGGYKFGTVGAADALGAAVKEILVVGQANEDHEPTSSLLILLPTLRLVLQIVLAQDLQGVKRDSPDALLSLASFHGVLLHTTQSIDALLAPVYAYLETVAYAPAFQGTLLTPVEEIQAQLKLHLAMCTEEWMVSVVRATKRVCAQHGIPATPPAVDRHGLKTSPYILEILQSILQPMGTFLSAEPSIPMRSYLLNTIVRHVLEAWIEELANVTKVSEAGSQQLRKDAEAIKFWCGDIDSRHRDHPGYSRLTSLTSLVRLDRMLLTWRQTGADMRKRRSSFDVTMDSSLITARNIPLHK